MRYILHPGVVTSTNDGDRHPVSAVQLATLYGVKLEDCLIFALRMYREQEGDIHLFPRTDGNYTLPDKPVTYADLAAAFEGVNTEFLRPGFVLGKVREVDYLHLEVQKLRELLGRCSICISDQLQRGRDIAGLLQDINDAGGA